MYAALYKCGKGSLSIHTARRSVTINFNSYVSGAHEAGLVGRLVGYRAMPEVISFVSDNSI